MYPCMTIVVYCQARDADLHVISLITLGFSIQYQFVYQMAFA
jgi:hypothetical protein